MSPGKSPFSNCRRGTEEAQELLAFRVEWSLVVHKVLTTL